jgi:ABC-2 type transport system permease protein
VSRLLSVEFRRFFARRLTRWLALAMFVGVVVSGVVITVNTSRDVAGAQQTAEHVRSKFLQSQTFARQDCLAHAPPDQVDQVCPPIDSQIPPASAFYRDPRYSFTDHVQDLVRGATSLGGLVAVLLAASFIGAEWQAGTFATLLMWEPRRARVAAAKVAAAVVSSLAIAVVAGALLVGFAALAAATRGTLHSVVTDARPQPHFAAQTIAMAGRGACIVALLALISAGLALLLRHTVAALGVFIAYLIVGEGILGSLRHGDVRHHLLQSRFAAVMNGRYTWFIPVRDAGGGIGFSPDHQKVVHALAAGLELAGVSALLLLVAVVALQRRDVT